MSDAAPDPMDKAYREAEAMLSDEAARAAMRAKVLAAVAEDTRAPARDAAPPPRRSVWRHSGWLAAASVAGLAVLIATRFERPTLPPSPDAKPPPVAPSASAPQAPATADALAGQPPAVVEQKPPVAPRAAAAPPPAQARLAAPEPRAFAPAPPLPQIPPLPVPPVEHRIEEPRPPSAPASADSQQPSVTAERRGPSAKAQSAPSRAASPSNTIEEMVVTQEHRALTGSPPERLRAAAEMGRTGDIEVLLLSGVDVDAADGEGETALMKAVQADQTAAAALLRRHGASLKRKNQAGVSALDMAKAAADPQLNRALGIKP